jgi:ribosomal protein L28
MRTGGSLQGTKSVTTSFRPPSASVWHVLLWCWKSPGFIRSLTTPRTRRRWLPNVQFKRFKSDVLGEVVPVHLTMAALRNMDKAGGFDNYILHTKVRICFQCLAEKNVLVMRVNFVLREL